MGNKVGVLVVDDSPICRQLICEALAKDPSLEVVGTCSNGEEAIASAMRLKPNVITMDVDMPVMDGLAAVEAIMLDNPTPILVLTADPQHQAPELTCRALELGALALQVKPEINSGPEAWNLAREVKLLASVKVIRHLRNCVKRAKPLQPAAPSPSLSPEAAPPSPGPLPEVAPLTQSPIGIVALVGSTGGPQVLHKLFRELPGDFPAPIVLVQHINASFAESLAGWLAASSKLKVRLGSEGDLLRPGEVLIAPPGKHMVIPVRGKVALRPGEPLDGHLPSGSLLLESVAQAYARRALGVILTGMGSDGAAGMAAIREAGGRTVAQSEDSCVVFGMPGAAIERNVVDHIVHADDLAASLLRMVRAERGTPAR